jgi:F420-0:gamma-glutamyl ligase
MQFITVKTRKFLPPKDDIFALFDEHLPKLKEGDVLLVTSKLLSIHQGRCVKKSKFKNQKSKLVKQEADYSLPAKMVKGSEIVLTIKDHTLIPSAGIDESNANGYLILWPKNTNRLCKQVCDYLKKKHHLKKLAMIVTDSHTTPLRWGTSGISIGFYGLEPLVDYRGKRDIFGRKLKYTQANMVDALSAMAVLLMGEGAERVPMVIIRGAKFIKFTSKATYKKFVIPPQKDLYYPLLKIFRPKS